jgi:hypothetical protein
VTEGRKANDEAVRRLTVARPLWVGVKPARELVDGLAGELLLHAGPPLSDEPGPLLRAALAGALVFEGSAASTAQAAARLPEIALASCNDRRTVAPLAGVVSGSMPMLVVRVQDSGLEAYSPLSEGGGCVLRFGCTRDEAIARVRHNADVVAPALDELLGQAGGIDVFGLIEAGLHLGDDCHHRFRGMQLSLALELNDLADRLAWPVERRRLVVEAVSENAYFPLNLVMAASKAAALAAEGVTGSSIITAIARNGVETGIRVSGLPGRWFTAPVEPVVGIPVEGPADALRLEPDTGDSCIVEVNGLGAFALAGAPTLARWFGGTPQALIELTTEMYGIASAEHPRFTLPMLGFRGTPVGIDCRRAVELRTSPLTETLQVTLERHPHVAAIGYSRVPAAALAAALDALGQVEPTAGVQG